MQNESQKLSVLWPTEGLVLSYRKSVICRISVTTVGMAAYSNSYSSGLEGNFYGFSNLPSSFSISTPGAYQINYSNSFGSYAPDLTNSA